MIKFYTLNYKKIISGILAFAGTLGIALEISLLGQSSVNRDILFVPMLFVLYKCYLYFLGIRETKGFYFLTGGLSFLFSAFLAMGAQVEIMTLSPIINTFVQICLLAVAIFPILVCITLWLNRQQETATIKSGNKRLAILCFIFLTLIWLISWLAMFPGVYATDAPYWYKEFSTSNIPITSQYSPLYCSIFYGLVKCGKTIFGSYNAGFAVFSFIQMIFILFVIKNILSFFCKRVGNVSVILVTAFYVFIPTHVILSVTSAQDPVFAACVAMAVIQLLELLIQKEMFWKSKKQITELFMWLALSCMMRNNGFYAIIIMLIFVIIFIRKQKKSLIITLIAVMSLIQLYQNPIYNILEIQKGTAIREILSLPLQQMAFAYNYNYEELSTDEILKLQQFISDAGWRSYEPCISDAVKRALDIEAIKRDTSGFIKLYFQVFCSSPESYIKATALQTFGLWYPNKAYPDARTWHPYINYQCYDYTNFKDIYDYDLEVSRTSLMPIYSDVLENLFGKGTYDDGYGGRLSMAFSNVPILGILCKAGIYTWTLIYLFCYGIYKKWSLHFGIIGLELGLWITIFLSPVIMYRYVAPIIFTAPLFLTLFFLPNNVKKQS